MYLKSIRLAIRYLQELAPVPELDTIVEQAPVPEEAQLLNKPHERCFLKNTRVAIR